MSDKDTKDPREDEDVPLMTDEDQQQDTEAAAEDSTDDAGDEYDIRDELDDYDRHVLDQLTDEELAALAGDDEDESEEEPEEADPAEAQADAEDEGDEAASPHAPQDTSAPPVTVGLNDEDRQRIKDAAKAARAEARQKWQDGDLTDEELDAAFDAADDAAEQEREAILAEKQQAAADAEFERFRADFMQEARKYLSQDYPELGDHKTHLPDFDRHVNIVTGSAKYAGMTPRQMLEAAHRLYIAEGEVLGVSVPPLKGSKPADTKEPQPKPKAKRNVVPTLAKVPAAATNTAADGKWGNLQARFDACTTADEMEKLMMSLTPDEMEAFASMDV